MKTRLGKTIHTASGLLLAAGLGVSNGTVAADFQFDKGEYSGSFLTSRFTFTGQRTLSTTVNGSVIGGSGEYAGAEGVLVSTSEGVLLEENRVDGRENPFGGTTGMFEGTFSTP